MKINNLIYLLLLLVSLTLKSQSNILEEKKLEKALKFLNDYKLDSAETEFKDLLKPEIKKNNSKIYIKSELNLGRIYGDKGNNVQALKYYQDALKVAESTKDKESIPHILKNIGILYVSWKKFDEAFNYYDKAEKLATEIGNKELIADCQNNKGIIYEQQKNYPKALSNYKSALELYIEKKNPQKISMALSNIAIVYKFQKNYPESIKYNFQAISIAEKLGDKWNMAATYNNIGNLYGEMGDYKKAILFCEKALKIAKEIHADEIIESTYDSMANAAEKAGDYKNAFAYQKLFSQVMNEFINKESTKQLSELNIKYETEKKQKLIQQQQFELKQKNIWLIFSGILFLISLLAAYFIYKNYRHKQNRKLQNQIFRQQELEAKALFEGEQHERIRIARDLHDGVGQMLSLVKMNLSTWEKDSVTEKTMNLVDKTIEEVRNVSHNLIPEELNFGIFSALDNLTEKVNSSGKTKMEIDIGKEIRAIKFSRQNELSIYRIVQEVVNNMLKHANANLINLSIKQVNQNIIISINDDGKGFDEESITNSKGMGWKNIKARIHLLDGKIKIHSEKLSGTQIKITLPRNGE
ncbi:tetratricopeptide repeat-containing sensor histidine kinase [Halpernia sp.]|uniref:tetratricopeptide repeat-containing sensor histidine kinase n=1 Tax=Halpernia sp. TaxID=2782209 RepID=UPI003A940BCB